MRCRHLFFAVCLAWSRSDTLPFKFHYPGQALQFRQDIRDRPGAMLHRPQDFAIKLSSLIAHVIRERKRFDAKPCRFQPGCRDPAP